MNLRGTGRTTRMLQAAVTAARNGKQVLIAVTDPNREMAFRDILRTKFQMRLGPGGTHRLEFYDGDGSIEFVALRDVNPRTGEVLGYPKAPVYVDHYDIEVKFDSERWLWREWLRWNGIEP